MTHPFRRPQMAVVRDLLATGVRYRRCPSGHARARAGADRGGCGWLRRGGRSAGLRGGRGGRRRSGCGGRTGATCDGALDRRINAVVSWLGGRSAKA